MKKIKVGIKGVDNVLNGGLPIGKSFLVSGACGAGKTIFASHFINEGIKGKQPGVYVSLEQDKDKLIADLKELSIHWQPRTKKLQIIGGSLGYIRKLKEERSATSQDFIEEIVEVVSELGAKRVVIDSINLFLDLFDSEPDKRKALTELLYQLQALGTTVMLTCEVKEKSEGISWYGFEEFVVDGVILLKRDYQKRLNNNKRTMEVVKMRGTNFREGNYPLKIIPNQGMEVYINDPGLEFFSG